MKKTLEDLYFSIKTINNYLQYITPILENDLNKKQLKVKDLEDSYEIAQKIFQVVEEFTIENPLNESQEHEINEKILQKLLELGYVKTTEDEKYELNISKGIFSDKTMSSLISEIRQSQKQIKLIYNNSLVNLVSIYECSHTNILKCLFMKYPESIGSEKTLKISEIKMMGSIEDAYNYLIEAELKDVMHKSVNDWHEYFNNKHKVKLEYFKFNKNNIVEIFERRNLIIHSNGVVNQIYCKNVDSSFLNDIKIGDEIKVNNEYIENASVLLLTDFIYIFIQIWDKNKDLSSDENDEYETAISTIGFEYMCLDKYEISYYIYRMLLETKKVNAASKIVYELNYWICCKRLGNRDDVLNKISSVDYSAYDKDYQIGLAALKVDEDTLKALFEKSDLNYMGKEELEEWPIFQWVRENELLYKELIKICKRKAHKKIEIGNEKLKIYDKDEELDYKQLEYEEVLN